MSARSFTVKFDPAAIADLRDRIARTRWSAGYLGDGWQRGAESGALKSLLAYWADGFDFEALEARFNRFDNFKAEIDGFDLHFIHLRSGRPDAIPLLLLHGWPSSILQMHHILPPLVSPADGDGPVFDVVVPSLPGYGFSSLPTGAGVNEGFAARLCGKLMRDVLGYQRYAVRGSDIGEAVARHLAHQTPEAVLGLHLSGTRPVIFEAPADLTEAEAAFVVSVRRWMEEERGYAMEHCTRPATIAHALADSPAGMAAWILEKFRAWSDCGGDLETRFSRDELLGNLSLYWLTQTINSSMQIYYESARAGALPDRTVPTAMLMSPHDLAFPPREWVERSGPVTRWTVTEQGGHFLEWEEPALVAGDLRAFFGPMTRS